jgi:hypothetical protein
LLLDKTQGKFLWDWPLEKYSAYGTQWNSCEIVPLIKPKGSALVLMRIRIQHFADPDSGQTLTRQQNMKPDLFVNFRSISMLLDPDPHSQSESRTAIWMRIHADSDPQNWDKPTKVLGRF